MPWLLPFFFVACHGDPAPSVVRGATLEEDGWLLVLADDPQLFGTLMASGERDGWIAYHKSDYAAAAQLFQDHHIARARSYLDLALLHEDLARISADTYGRTFRLWEEKNGIPSGSALPVIAALAAAEKGDRALRDQWLNKSRPTDAHVQALASRLTIDLSDWTEPQAAEGQLVVCVWAHLEARRTGDDLLLGEACPAGPLVTEQAPDHLRTFYNPMLHTTEAAVNWSAAYRALRSAGPATLDDERMASGDAVTDRATHLNRLLLLAQDEGHALEALLFSPWWTGRDLEDDLTRDPSLRTSGAAGPTLLALGVLDTRPPDQSTDWARTRARSLEAQLERWETDALSSRTAEQAQLLAELELVPQYKSKVLLAWARTALDDGRPQEALAFSQVALDVERSRDITPINTPGIFAAMAEADLKTGRTRESLDALQVLMGRFPEVEGLDETIGDLAILEALDRQGDSKEN